MKNYLFAMAMLSFTCMASNASFADACKDCVNTTDHILAVTECVNDFLLDNDTCEGLLKSGACSKDCQQAPKYKVTKAL